MEQATLIEHLTELRDRLIKTLLAFVVAACASYFFAEDLYRVLVHPLAEAFGPGSERRLIYTDLTEAFVTYLTLACYGGVFFAFPVAAFQLFRFIAPGLYRHERRVFSMFLVAGPVLFMAGLALVYFFVLPAAWGFFLSFESAPVAGEPAIQLEARVGEYLSLVLQLMLAFGLAFQMPLILMLLAKVGLVTPDSLRRKRRLAIVVIFVVAAILTPPDVISQTALALPLLLLYEGAIWGCRWVAPKVEPEETQELLSHAGH